MNIKDIQRQFNLDQVWIMTIQASFQRANVYKAHSNKEQRKRELRKQIEELARQYDQEISEEQHIENILSLKCQDDIGLNINFGVAQKLLNLYLKYLWTLGYLQYPPPHFPVDRLIQQALKYKPLFNWTELDSVETYKRFIEFAKVRMNKEPFDSIAELELAIYNVWINRNGE
ncbi:hypothetical protein [Sphingobacterium faecium]|uniref:hypothetical protein n=1 Tax=Sphingobacterium faecium TaxID=34087 RepID=UPI00320944E7